MFLGSIEVLSTSVLETGETEGGRDTIGMMAVTGVTVQHEEMWLSSEARKESPNGSGPIREP